MAQKKEDQPSTLLYGVSLVSHEGALPSTTVGLQWGSDWRERVEQQTGPLSKEEALMLLSIPAFVKKMTIATLRATIGNKLGENLMLEEPSIADVREHGGATPFKADEATIILPPRANEAIKRDAKAMGANPSQRSVSEILRAFDNQYYATIHDNQKDALSAVDERIHSLSENIDDFAQIMRIQSALDPKTDAEQFEKCQRLSYELLQMTLIDAGQLLITMRRQFANHAALKPEYDRDAGTMMREITQELLQHHLKTQSEHITDPAAKLRYYQLASATFDMVMKDKTVGVA